MEKLTFAPPYIYIKQLTYSKKTSLTRRHAPTNAHANKYLEVMLGLFAKNVFFIMKRWYRCIVFTHKAINGADNSYSNSTKAFKSRINITRRRLTNTVTQHDWPRGLQPRNINQFWRTKQEFERDFIKKY